MVRLHWFQIIAMISCLLIHSSRAVPTHAGTGTGAQAHGVSGDDTLHDDYHEDANADSYSEEENEEDAENDNLSLPVITTKSMTIEGDIGGEIELLCEGDPGVYVIIWEKEDQPLFLGHISQTNDKRLSVQDSSTKLLIKNVSALDTGKYKCRYSTQNKPIEVIHMVHVRVGPGVNVDPPVRVLNQGEPAAFVCNVSGYPIPSVYWQRKNNKKMPGGEERIEGNIISFASVNRHYAGIYECYAENIIGSARTALDLQVRYAPEIEVEKESVNTGLGLDADLVCFIHAEPKANVVWYKNGQLINEVTLGYKGHELVEHVSHRYILHLKNVKEDDFGRYTCAASNRLGRTNKSILLSGVPSQPVVESEKSRVTRVGKESVSYNLVWVLESTIPVDNYKLKFRQADEDWTEATVEGSEISPQVYVVSHTLNNLVPSTDYQASLSAHNQYGWSPESHVHNFHTDELSLGDDMGSGAKAVESIAGSSGISSVAFSFEILVASVLLIALTRQRIFPITTC